MALVTSQVETDWMKTWATEIESQLYVALVDALINEWVQSGSCPVPA